MSAAANERALATAVAAALELARGPALLERALELAEDVSSPGGNNGYKLDAQERAEMRASLERYRAWEDKHRKLLAWASNVAARPRGAPAPAAPDAGPGRW